MRVRALLVLLLTLGCTSEGTDLEGYPFVAIDNTEPGTTHVTVPVALSSYDTGKPHRVIRDHENKKKPIDPQAPKNYQASKLQILFPLITLDEENRERELRVFAPVLLPFTSSFAAIAGPAGRAMGKVTPLTQHPSSVVGSVGPTENPFATLPLLGYDRVHIDPSNPTETKHDFGLMPLFMGGDWGLKGGYFVLAPFGGTTKGFLGKDEMTWVGFPYPFYLYARERDIESRHVLWPIVNWVEGGGRSGFRIWPFYAHYRRTDLLGREAYDRHWVMWPLVSWARNSGQQGSYDESSGEFRATPTEELFIFPFFGRIVGPDDKNYTVLWPFFRYEEVPSTNFWELRAPFPIFTMHHGSDPALARQGKNAERVRFDIWPLGGYRARPGYVRHFFVWPIERYENRDDEWVRDTKFFLVPFVQWHHHHEKASGQNYQRTRIWPFFIYRRGVLNDVEFHTIAPLLWDDPNGFERIIYPFLRLYEYKRSSWGAVHHRFLFGLASWRNEPPVEGVTDGYSRLSVLFGLFQYRSGGTTREESSRSGFRLFYLPEISWGGDGQ